MIDHAQAKIRVLNSAIAIARLIKGNDLNKMPEYCARLISELKVNVHTLNETQKPSYQSDDDYDGDHFHGCS